MNRIMIAHLKARLSQYLAQVRRGHTLTILNRDTPIARIVPYSQEAIFLTVRRPVAGSRPLRKVPLPPPLATTVDIVDLLMEERQGER